MPINQSVSWWCFSNRGVTDEALLKQAKEIGYAAVELIGEDLFDAVVGNGLVIASHGGHQSIENGMNDLGEHDRIIGEIDKNLAVAVKYKIPNLIVFSGNRREGLTEDQGAENTAACLKRAAKSAEDAGINLVIELLNSKVDHKGYQCDRSDWGIQVCKMVDSPRVKLLYDIYHMQIMEGDLIRTIRDHHAYFAHYHTAGNPGRNDMDGTQEITYPPIMRAILETGYTGYVGHEFVPKGEPVAALKAAYDLCNVTI